MKIKSARSEIALKLILSFSLLLSLMGNSYIYADGGSSPALNLQTGVSISVSDQQLMKTKDGKVATFTTEVKNTSNETVALIDYWARIKGKNNKSYVTKLIPADKTKEIVKANSTTSLTFYANVEQSVSMSDLSLDIIKWDFSMPNYERIAGNLKPLNDGITPYGKAKSFVLGKDLKLTVGSYSMYKDIQYGYLNLDLTVTNTSNSVVEFKDLNFSIVVNDNAVYPLQQILDSVTLKAKETKKITIPAILPVGHMEKSMVLYATMKDETGELTYSLGAFQLPKLEVTKAIAINKATTIQVNGQAYSFNAQPSVLANENNRTILTSKIKVINQGTSATAYPDLMFYLMTKDGYLYPLAKEGESKESLLPKIEQVITVSGQVPSSDAIKNSQLVAFYENSDRSLSYFITSFQMKLENNTSEETESTSEYVYKDMLIKQVSLQRVPNDMQDMIIAEFEVKNNSKKSQAKINPSGSFILDGVKLPENLTKIVNTDSTYLIGAGQSYRFIVYTTVPYTQSVDKYEFSLSDIQSDETKKTVNTFILDQWNKASLLASNQTYKINTVGKRSEISFVESSLYSGERADLFYAELLYNNSETREAVPSKLSGYIKNKNDQLVQVEFSTYEQKLLPSGSMMVSAWATIPKSYDKTGLEFYFGESLTLEEEKVSAVLKPVYTVFTNKEASIVKATDLLNVSEYELQFGGFNTLLGSSDGMVPDTLDLNFNYTLKYDEDGAIATKPHQIIVEFEDLSAPAIIFSKTYTLNGEAGENNLAIGKDKKLSIAHQNQLILQKPVIDYKINVYDVVNGYKKLIATEQFKFMR